MSQYEAVAPHEDKCASSVPCDMSLFCRVLLSSGESAIERVVRL